MLFLTATLRNCQKGTSLSPKHDRRSCTTARQCKKNVKGLDLVGKFCRCVGRRCTLTRDGMTRSTLSCKAAVVHAGVRNSKRRLACHRRSSLRSTPSRLFGWHQQGSGCHRSAAERKLKASTRTAGKSLFIPDGPENDAVSQRLAEVELTAECKEIW